ncbi:hypothetical protein L2E82_45159 [Cichorium intybus]|uniref:Uncharacterized protein n=1 Tax=Cichorium intybus TaxID=13427 RepID=A0ACB8ZSC6_CICIN|nr:hypothetical protein L2E82_45159 [Cichorium intybus]
MLLDHGERILSSATSIFKTRGVKISVKVAGIHRHYGRRYGYLPIAQMLARHGAVFNFTCIKNQDARPRTATYAQCSKRLNDRLSVSCYFTTSPRLKILGSPCFIDSGSRYLHDWSGQMRNSVG